MKQIITILFLLTFISCSDHSRSYKFVNVEVTYSNGDVDTIKNLIVYNDETLVLSKGDLYAWGNNEPVIVSGVRKFKVIK